jgi:hypothetical protein
MLLLVLLTGPAAFGAAAALLLPVVAAWAQELDTREDTWEKEKRRTASSQRAASALHFPVLSSSLGVY